MSLANSIAVSVLTPKDPKDTTVIVDMAYISLVLIGVLVLILYFDTDIPDSYREAISYFIPFLIIINIVIIRYLEKNG